MDYIFLPKDNKAIEYLKKYIKEKEPNCKLETKLTLVVFEEIYININNPEFYKSSNEIMVLRSTENDLLAFKNFFSGLIKGCIEFKSINESVLQQKKFIIKKYLQYFYSIANDTRFNEDIKIEDYFDENENGNENVVLKSNEKFTQLGQLFINKKIDIEKLVYYCDHPKVTKGTLFLVRDVKHVENVLKEKLKYLKGANKSAPIIECIKNANDLFIKKIIHIKKYEYLMNGYMRYLQNKEVKKIQNIWYKILNCVRDKNISANLSEIFESMLLTFKFIFNIEFKPEDIKEIGTYILQLLQGTSRAVKALMKDNQSSTNYETIKNLLGSENPGALKKIYKKLTDIIISNGECSSNEEIIEAIKTADTKITFKVSYNQRGKRKDISIGSKKMDDARYTMNEEWKSFVAKIDWSLMSDKDKTKNKLSFFHLKIEKMYKKIDEFIKNIQKNFALYIDQLEDTAGKIMDMDEENFKDNDIDQLEDTAGKIMDMDEENFKESDNDNDDYKHKLIVKLQNNIKLEALYQDVQTCERDVQTCERDEKNFDDEDNVSNGNDHIPITRSGRVKNENTINIVDMDQKDLSVSTEWTCIIKIDQNIDTVGNDIVTSDNINSI